MLEKKCVSHIKSLVVIHYLSLSFYFYYLVEAHSPFICGPAPLTEGSEDADRILNLVATGGTDKVNIRKYTHHSHPLTTTAQDMATL